MTLLTPPSRSPRLQVAALACFLLAQAPEPAAHAAVLIQVPESKRRDAGLTLALSDLTAVLEDTRIHYGDEGVKQPADDDRITLLDPRRHGARAWPGARPEAYSIEPVAAEPGRSLVLRGADARGLMYGVFKLAERIRLGEDPFKLRMNAAPAFPMRMFSEQGQLLDLPDRNYYSDMPPYVDEKRLRTEIDEARKRVDHVARLGYNTITFLHVNCEEYIDYKYLDQPIYEEGDRHLSRSPVFGRYLSELCDYAHARHLDVFLQLYEIQYPARVDELYGVDLDSPNIQRIIDAKVRELFERVPLDGLVITPTESHPRCGYRSKHLWARRGRRGAGEMLTLYHKASRAAGKTAAFRLWRIATDTGGAREALAHVPRDAMFSVKNTGGDFWLNSPLTDIVTGGLGRDHPLMVLFDTFRQYDGWSRCFCYMQQWGERVRLCHENKVRAINAWGAWSPGCIWPDFEPGYMKGADGRDQRGGPVAWAGYWNDFRMFTRGFSPGQANAYLLARLCWQPGANVEEIARDFAALHLGADNAEAAAEALLCTQEAWWAHYPGDAPGQVTHPTYMKWALVFGPRAKEMEEAYQNLSLKRALESNRQALAKLDQMQAAFARTDRARAPDPLVYDRFREGIDKTALTLHTLHAYREFYIASHDYARSPSRRF